MRKILVSNVFFMFCNIVVLAQDLRVGVKMGPSATKLRDGFSKIFDESVAYKHGINGQAGMFGIWRVPSPDNDVYIRADLEVSKNFSVDDEALNIRYDYWLASVPVYFSFGQGNSPYRLNLGAKFSKLIDGREAQKNAGLDETIVYKPLMTAVSFGVDYYIHDRWALQFSYDYGMTDFWKSKESDELYANSLQISLNYTLFHIMKP